jgi:hypothetical protein
MEKEEEDESKEEETAPAAAAAAAAEGGEAAEAEAEAPAAAEGEGGLRCPEGMDPETFACLPEDIQREVWERDSDFSCCWDVFFPHVVSYDASMLELILCRGVVFMYGSKERGRGFYAVFSWVFASGPIHLLTNPPTTTTKTKTAHP